MSAEDIRRYAEDFRTLKKGGRALENLFPLKFPLTALKSGPVALKIIKGPLDSGDFPLKFLRAQP